MERTQRKRMKKKKVALRAIGKNEIAMCEASFVFGYIS